MRCRGDASIIHANRPEEKQRMNASDAHHNLLASTRRLLQSLTAPPLAPFLAEWPRPGAALMSGAADLGARGANLPALPVLNWLPTIAGAADVWDAALVAALCQAAPLLEWRQTYTAHEVGGRFLQNYGWSEIVGPKGLESSARIACGFLLLGPDTFYPRHRHAAEEFYVPLSGTAQWQQGDAIWRHRGPGALIHHRSDEAHAMRTADAPLLALYLWRGADLLQQSHLD
jgi:hypothetical protein